MQDHLVLPGIIYRNILWHWYSPWRSGVRWETGIFPLVKADGVAKISTCSSENEFFLQKRYSDYH